jgi:hypothetical protein
MPVTKIFTYDIIALNQGSEMNPAYYTRLLLKSRLSLGIVCFLLLTIILPAFSCSDNSAQIIEMFMQDMVNGTDSATAQSISRLQNIEQQIDAIRVNRNALEQVATPAKEWMLLQAANAKKYSWSRKTLQVIGDLPRLRNDKYEVAKLVFLMQIMGTYQAVIDIKDISTGEIESYYKLRDALDEAEYSLVQEGNMISNSIEIASNTVNRLAGRAGEIVVTPINKTEYKLVGPLGLDADNNLMTSEWTYNIELNMAEPAESAAIRLQKALTCKL